MTEPARAPTVWKAVIAGGIVDLVATNIVAIPVVVLMMVRNRALMDDTEAVLSALIADPSYATTLLLLGSACSVLGGWIAASIARRDAMRHGMLSSVPCTLLGVYGFVRHPETVRLLDMIATVVLALALGALGGTLWERRARAARAAPPPQPAAVTEPLPPRSRLVLALNLIGILFVSLGGLLFAAAALAGAPAEGDALASAVLVIVALFSLVCLLRARRAYRAHRPSHAAWHVAATFLGLAPVAMLVVVIVTLVRDLR